MDVDGPNPVYELKTPAAERLAHLISLAQDLIDARSHALMLRDELIRIDTAGEDSDSKLSQALFTSAVITYNRAFATGRRSGLSEADFAAVDPVALQAHRWFVQVRDRHIAHQVLPLEEVRIGIAMDPSSDPVEVGIASLSMKHQATDVQGTETLVQLINVLLSRLRELTNLQEEIVLKEAQAMDPSEVVKLPTLRIDVQEIPLDQGPAR